MQTSTAQAGFGVLLLLFVAGVVGDVCPADPREYYYWSDNVRACADAGVGRNVTEATLCAIMRNYTIASVMRCSARADEIDAKSKRESEVCDPASCFACLCCGAHQVRGADPQALFQSLLRVSTCWADNFVNGTQVGNLTVALWLQLRGYPQATCLDRFFCSGQYGFGVPKRRCRSNSPCFCYL
jgi:hypothetical protein